MTHSFKISINPYFHIRLQLFILIDLSMALYFWCENFENLFIVEVYSTFSSVTLVGYEKLVKKILVT